MLAGFAKRDGLSTEGAIKYFLLGSFSSAILLFGLAFVFGYTGHDQHRRDRGQPHRGRSTARRCPSGSRWASRSSSPGGAFKIAAVPFHYWTPDAYQGSPTPVTGYLSVGPKVAAFALLLRLFVEALGPMRADWGVLMGVLAALTMTLGNLSALGQDNIKRMLGYSSIAHTGYIMVGLTVYAVSSDPEVQADGLQGVLFYSVAYAFMNLGAFACVAALQRRPGVTSQISTFAGLGRRAPLLGITMTLFLLSLVGIPPTAGFFAKAVIIISAVEGGRLADGAGGDHDAQRRGRRVLLPAGGRGDVHARRAGRRTTGHGRQPHPGGPRHRGRRDGRHRPPARGDRRHPRLDHQHREVPHRGLRLALGPARSGRHPAVTGSEPDRPPAALRHVPHPGGCSSEEVLE